MSDSLQRLRHQIDRARQLGTVVHAMKALATMNVGQYERAVQSLQDYVRTVELGLTVCLRSRPNEPEMRRGGGAVAAVMFGSDQGLVGRFNEVMADFARSELQRHGQPAQLWVIGERLGARLAAERPCAMDTLILPSSLAAVSPFVTQLLLKLEPYAASHPEAVILVLFNRLATAATYEPACEQLLPFDAQWRRRFASMRWPTNNVPETIGPPLPALRSHLSEYLFASLFRACVESQASENASRLAAMQRAERNIDALLETLTQTFNGLRQSAIDEELFDVIAGFEALPHQ